MAKGSKSLISPALQAQPVPLANAAPDVKARLAAVLLGRQPQLAMPVGSMLPNAARGTTRVPRETITRPYAPPVRSMIPNAGQRSDATPSLDDRDYLIRTVIGEAGNQDARGKQAVASVVLNRVKSGWGSSVKDVVTAKNQFEPWNREDAKARMLSISPDSQEYRDAAAAVDAAEAGDDPTGGATHFLNADIVRQRRGGSLPGWANPAEQTVQIGDHTFYKPAGGGMLAARVGGMMDGGLSGSMAQDALRGGAGGDTLQQAGMDGPAGLPAPGGAPGGGTGLETVVAQLLRQAGGQNIAMPVQSMLPQAGQPAQPPSGGPMQPGMPALPPPQTIAPPPGGLPADTGLPAGAAAGSPPPAAAALQPSPTQGTFSGSPTAPWAGQQGDPQQLDVRALLGDYLRQQRNSSFFNALGRIGARIGSGQPWGASIAQGAVESQPEQLRLGEMLGLAQLQEGQGRERLGRQAVRNAGGDPNQPEWLQQENYAQAHPGRKPPININGMLVDPDTYQPVADYRTPEKPDYEEFPLADGTVQKTRYVAGAPDVGFGPDTVPVGKPGKKGAAVSITNNLDLTKSTTTGLQGKVISGRDQLSRLQVIKSEFKPEWAQFQPRAGLAWSAFKDKIGALDPSKKAELAAFTRWRSDSFDHLNQILKDMAGTAVTPNEMERQLRALPNPGEGVFDGDGPTEYMSKLDAATQRMTNAVYRYNYALKHGLNPLDTKTKMDENLDAVPEFIDSVGAQIEEQVKAENPGMAQDAIDAEVAQRLQNEFGMQQ